MKWKEIKGFENYQISNKGFIWKFASEEGVSTIERVDN